jgi:thiol-disulfide isomerase/thioredoxin
MDTQKKVLLVVILVVVVGSIVWLEAIKPHNGPSQTVQQEIANETSTATTVGGGASSTGTFAAPGGAAALTETPAQFLADRAAIVAQESSQYVAAPEITDPTGWINTQPFTLASLVGSKVVLVDFWTYSCINCIRTIPYVNAWYAKYKNAGLVIVGVHTPEFQFEHDISNVQAAVKQLGIQYPVVLDSNMGTWDAYNNLYWPAEYLINVDGFIVHNSIGEGNYDETETAIQQALMQRDEALGIPTSTVPTGFVNPTSTIAINYNDVQSPETYFGADRNQYLANGPQMTNGTYSLTAPTGATTIGSGALQENSLYLDGQWDFEDQYATNLTAPAKIFYEYDSKNVYMVAASDNPNKPVTVQVWVDGAQTGTVTIQANQLYNIVQGSSYGEHTLELVVENPGLDAYTFTFG